MKREIDIKIPSELANKLVPGIYKNSHGKWVAHTHTYNAKKDKYVTTEIPFGPALNTLFNLVEEHSRADAIQDIIQKLDTVK